MDDISEIQRVADAFATLAGNIAGTGGVASRGHEHDLVLRAIAPVARTEREGRYPDRYTPIPRNGVRCEFTGLRHAKLYHLLSTGGPVLADKQAEP